LEDDLIKLLQIVGEPSLTEMQLRLQSKALLEINGDPSFTPTVLKPVK
jgi:hypothetical protein